MSPQHGPSVPAGRARVRVEFTVRISDPSKQALAEEAVLQRLNRMRVVSDSGLVESIRVVGL